MEFFIAAKGGSAAKIGQIAVAIQRRLQQLAAVAAALGAAAAAVASSCQPQRLRHRQVY